MGAGALGPVFRAFDPGGDPSSASGSSRGESQGDRLVAIKLFRLDLAPERVHQLVAEFERLIAAHLAHPTVAAPFSAGIAGTQPYLVYEFIRADSLDIVIRDNGPAPLDHAIRVVTQLAGAIDYAAAVGVAHGALHPRDVLISAEDTRLTGFGVAQALARIGVAPPMRRPYAAPERVEQGAWDRRADIFSLAAVAYELMTGRRIPGPGPDAAEGIDAVGGVDAALARAVFARALAVEPTLRFETALEFARALQAAVAAQTAGSRLDHPSARPPRGVERARDIEPLLPLEVPETATPAEPSAQVDTPAFLDARSSPAAVEPIVAPPSARFEPDDVELVRAEAERYEDVESSPAVTPEVSIRPAGDRRDEPAIRRAELLPVTPAALPPVGLNDIGRPAAPAIFTESALERSRSALWPLVLALAVGLALGFGAGYAVGTRAPLAQSAAGREYTETAVPPVAKEALQPEPEVVHPPAESAGAPTATSGAPAASLPPAAQNPPAAKTPPPAEAPAAETEAEAGRLLVRSTPAGARVIVDGRERGRTPVAVRDLARGLHRVRIVQDGYTMEERRVVVSPRQPAQSLEITLTRTRTAPAAMPPAPAAARGADETFVGAMIVDSRPTGAKVYVDGRLVGTTPLEMPNVAAGSHVVRIEHDGYRRWSSAVRVVAGERNRVTASLEK